MEVNNKTVSNQNEPAVEQLDKEEPAHEKQPSVEQTESIQEIKELQLAVQNDFAEKVETTKEPRKRGRPKGVKTRKAGKIKNLLSKRKCEPSSRLSYNVPEPEEWTSRLRQSGREVVLDRIKTVSQDILRLTKEESHEKRANDKRRCSEQKRFPQYTFVKVEDGIQTKNECTEQHSQQISFAELGLIKMEKVDVITDESAVRHTHQNGFPELAFVKVEGGLQIEDSRHSKIMRQEDCNHAKESIQERLANETDKNDNVRRKRKIPERYRIARATDPAKERSLRLQREKIERARRRANETEEERVIRLERQRMSRILRRVAETEEERSIRLENIRMANWKLRETETEEERVVRLKRIKKATLKHRAAETDEQRSTRLERIRKRGKIRYLREKNLKAAGIHLKIRILIHNSNYFQESASKVRKGNKVTRKVLQED